MSLSSYREVQKIGQGQKGFLLTSYNPSFIPISRIADLLPPTPDLRKL